MQRRLVQGKCWTTACGGRERSPAGVGRPKALCHLRVSLVRCLSLRGDQLPCAPMCKRRPVPPGERTPLPELLPDNIVREGHSSAQA